MSSPHDTDVTSPHPPQMGRENQQPISLPSTGIPGNDHSNNLLTSSQNSSITSPSVSTSHSFQCNRLPKLVLPSFNGNPLEWQSFLDNFRPAVYDISAISDVQKFNYLRAQSRDGAERVIARLPLTSANYAKSIQLLEERFAQPHQIISPHMEALFNLPSPADHFSSSRFLLRLN